jgi:hypothetical protein
MKLSTIKIWKIGDPDNTSLTYQSTRTMQQPVMGTKTLLSFLALTFGLSWAPIALFIIFPDQLTPIFGEISTSKPFFLLAVYAPGLSGIFLIWHHHGLKGLDSFFRRLFIWRAPIQWWLFLLLGIPIIVYAVSALKGSIHDPFAFSPWYMVFPPLAHRPEHSCGEKDVMEGGCAEDHFHLLFARRDE